MAYSPLDHGRLLGRLLRDPVLRGIALQYRVNPAEIALAWVLAHPGVCAIPEAATVEHVRRNRAVLDLRLREIDMIKLEEASRRRSRRSRSTCARRSRRR